MADIQKDIEQLERSLFMRGLGALTADRTRCSDCGRTPLIGEQVHLYEGDSAGSSEVVCELCRQLRREPSLASETVHHGEHGQTVRLTARAA
jgi:hypothetical protein